MLTIDRAWYECNCEPNMTAELKALIDQCEYCPKEPLIPSRAPTYPFQQVPTNYFEVNNHSYLVYVNQG